MLHGGWRGRLLSSLALMLALGACLPVGGGDPAPSITGPEVETTTLPAMGEAGAPAASGAGVEAAPGRAGAAAETAAAEDAETTPTDAAPTAETPAPVVRSPAQIACEADRGRYVRVGSGSLMACQRPTRDSGKSCNRKSDCQGDCLARSGTCAPLTPLFGCNEIFQDDGRRVSLCIE